MIEIRSKRNLTSKHFDKGNGEFAMDAHVSHIHYLNKLGLGDSQDDYRGIDYTLSFDQAKRGWYFEYHSFHPFLPEYADEWIEFRDLYDGKDQTIRYRAQCEHVLGRLVMPGDIGLTSTDVNCVIYDDAFGKGYDLILYFALGGLKKVIRIREESKKAEADLTFDFEVKFPRDKSNKEFDVIRAENKKQLVEKDKAYILDLTAAKQFDTAKQTLIGNDKKDGKEWFTYLLPFQIWDDSGKKETIKVNYFVRDEKKYLQKIVTKAFLDGSTGNVYADITTNYYGSSEAGCGNILNTSAGGVYVWATARSMESLETGPGTQFDACTYPSGGYGINRYFMNIDTSGMGEGSTPTTAYLKTKGQQILTEGSSRAQGIYWSDCHDEIVAADFKGGIELDSPTAYMDSTMPESSFSNGNWTTWNDWNQDGLDAIDPAGLTKFSVREANCDVADVAPTGVAVTRCYGVTGTANDPYLVVTYTPPPGGTYTSNANLKKSVTGNFSGYANLKYTVPDDFTGDSIVFTRWEDEFTGEANLIGSEATQFYGNAYLYDTAMAKETSPWLYGTIYGGWPKIWLFDANIFSGDANLVKTESREFNSDANLNAYIPGSLTGDANLLKETLISFTGDSNLLGTITPDSFCGDASILLSAIDDFTGDANLKSNEPEQFSGDSNLLTTLPFEFKSDAGIFTQTIESYTSHANLLKDVTQSFAGQASLLSTIGESLIANANLKKDVSSTFAGLASLKAVLTSDFKGDADLKSTEAVVFTGDANLELITWHQFLGYANLKSIESNDFTGDTLLVTLVTGSYAGDANMLKSVIDGLSGNASLLGAITGQIQGDSNLRRTDIPEQFLANASMVKLITTGFSGNANLLTTETSTFNGDSNLSRHDIPGQFTGDASLRSIISGTLTGDSNLLGNIILGYSGDSNLNVRITSVFSAGASLLRRLALQFTADASLKSLIHNLFTGDASLKSIETVSFTADSNLKLENITFNFKSDASLKKIITTLYTGDASLLSIENTQYTGDALLMAEKCAGFAGAITTETTGKNNFAGTVTLDNTQQQLGFGVSGCLQYPLKIDK